MEEQRSTNEQSEQSKLDRAKERFDKNIERCRTMYRHTMTTNMVIKHVFEKKREDVGEDEFGDLLPVEKLVGLRDDILRSTVVFAHAAFDDFIRCILRHRALSMGRDILQAVQDRPNRGSQARKVRFDLVELWEDHRDKSVKQLVVETVEAWVAYRSINNVDELAYTLGLLSIDVGELMNDHSSALDMLFKRRHNIVHRADIESFDSDEAEPMTQEEHGRLTDSIGQLVAFADGVMKAAKKDGGVAEKY